MMNKLIKNVYIHLPFCLKKCYFCAFPVHAIGHEQTQHTQKLLENYFHQLKKEIILGTQQQNYSTIAFNHNKKSILTESTIETIYFGGGTPSLFKPSQISQLINLVKSISNSLKSDPEITLEINPQEIQLIPAFHQAGVNRFSIGIQSLNPYQLKKFNRSEYFSMKQLVNSSEVMKRSEQYYQRIVQKLMSYMKNRKLINFNVDFILDLNPQPQDEQLIYRFIETVKPPHLTLYLLQVIENTYLQRSLNIKQSNLITEEFSGLVNNFETIHERYIEFSNRLKNIYGYCHYQVSNFARNDDSSFQSKHNQVYWEGNKEFLGFGMGASSLLKGNNLNPYYRNHLPSNLLHDKSQINMNKELFRVTNPKSIKKYETYVNQLQNFLIQKEYKNHKQTYQSDQKLSEFIKTRNFNAEINLQSSPVGIIQSYIMSSVRTYQGVSYDKIKVMISDSDNIQQNKVKVYFECLIKKIEKILNDQFLTSQGIFKGNEGQYQSKTQQNQYFQFLYSSISNQQSDSLIISPSYPIIGFRLKSPHGYLIADEIAHKISVLIEEVFTNKL